MLLNLHIKNLALIDELDIDFFKGLNILTGETGAGKSIIVGSIGIGLGGRFGRDLLRDKDKDGMVELIFSVDNDSIRNKLREIDVEAEDDTVIISRRVTGSRTVNRINDETVSVGKLREVSEILINLHAQHEQQTLLKESKHLDIIDASDQSIPALKEKVRTAFREYKDVKAKIDSLLLDEGERKKRQDFLKFQIDEISEASLKEGEDTQLEDLYRKIKASHDIAEIAGEVHSITGYEMEESAGNLLSRACAKIRELSKYDNSPEADSLMKSLSDVDGILNDFNKDISQYIESVEFEPGLLRETEDRLDKINTIKSKFGKTIADVQDTFESLKKEYEELVGFDEAYIELKENETKLFDELKEVSESLTKQRKKAAKVLSEKISTALESLNFSRIIFYADIKELPEYTENGHDSAVFMISTNVGEKEKPLTSVASGGELSRVMLAIKSVLADADDTPTLVFDEIDVGISGITAQKVAEMMRVLANDHQIISITHLPQIAAAADSHFLIEKSVDSGKTYTGIRHLNEEESIYELARILGGENITESVLSSAREMINAMQKS